MSVRAFVGWMRYKCFVLEFSENVPVHNTITERTLPDGGNLLVGYRCGKHSFQTFFFQFLAGGSTTYTLTQGFFSKKLLGEYSRLPLIRNLIIRMFQYNSNLRCPIIYLKNRNKFRLDATRNYRCDILGLQTRHALSWRR